MTTTAALVILLIVFVNPPLGMPAIVVTVNLCMWRRHREVMRAQQARARAKDEEHDLCELRAALRHFR